MISNIVGVCGEIIFGIWIINLLSSWLLDIDFIKLLRTIIAKYFK